MQPVASIWYGVDPLAEKYPNVSGYVYCIGNPVKLIDTDGRKIVLVGSKKERMTILRYLQRLTNDNLSVNKKTGEVTIRGKRWDNRNKKLNVGTALIRDVINHKRTTKIQIGEEEDVNRYHATYRRDQSNGKGTDGYINLNFSQPVDLTVEDSKTGKTIKEHAPMEITIGHELIHAYSAMNGDAAPEYYESNYRYKNTEGKLVETKSWTTELETVGIIGNRKYTENKLRKEHKLNKRVKY